MIGFFKGTGFSKGIIFRFSKGIMFGVSEGIFFEYKGKLMSFSSSYDGLYINDYISDYREITEEREKYINDMEFDLVLVNDNPIVYRDFSCLEEAIKKEDEYRLDMNWGKSYSLDLYKAIDLKDIKAFYRIDSFLQIQGMKFRFCKTLYFKEDGDYFRDKFDISPDGLTEEQIITLKSLGCVFTRDIPANRGERAQIMTCLVPFNAIDGFVIEKQNFDINSIAEYKQRPVGEKEIYFLDKENPDPELWKMLESHWLIYDMDPYDA
ncbi:MAG: hypothetical protein UH850_04595 [Paludibacteraceae bacterium]|nr:hypothetical protein [Paludibacteraceae bacterium]